MELIRQRTQNECSIASVAMALNLDYDYVLNIALISDAKHSDDVGTHTSTLLNALRVNYNATYDHRKNFGPGYWKDFLWGRRALISADSLNVEDGKHIVYWDYNKILDPQNGNVVDGEPKKFFTDLSEMKIETIYTLCECGCDPKPKWKIDRVPEELQLTEVSTTNEATHSC